MANDKREQLIELARTYWIAQANKTTEWDTAEIIADFAIDYAAATSEAQSDGWVAIETVDDLPKVGGRYLWQFRNVDDGIEFDLRIFKPSMDGQDFVKVFVAWKRPAPYQHKSEGDSNER